MQNKIQHPRLGWWLAIVGGMGLTALIAYSPDAYPIWQTRVTALIPQEGFQWIWWAALAAHAGEASYALLICRRRRLATTLQWTLQTFLLGYPSLRLLKQSLSLSPDRTPGAGFQPE